MRRRAGALAVLTLLVIPAAASALSTPLVANTNSESNGHGLFRRPELVVYSADGAAFVSGQGVPGSPVHPGRLHWTTWNSSEARAWGADWHDNCEPSCAQGTYFPYRANVHLYRPRVVGGHWLFTRMTVTYTGQRPPHPAYRTRASWTMRLGYSAQYATYFWH